MDLEMKKTLAMVIILLSSIKPASSDESELQSYTQKQLLKNWILSRCLAKAYPSEQAKQDAEISASAYLEYGKASIEAYEKGDKLVDKFLSRKYSGSIKSTYNTMKCIDLFLSKEVEKLVHKYSEP
ncbi:hypothetical protein BROC_02323 [Candidatus Brocadiaceae bacterium]|nr:hypothetical protein BROC_02323 [Candidatus Brocadiaceae bacterium]